MLKESGNIKSGSANFSIKKNRAIDAIISFLDEKLPLFKCDLQIGLTDEDEISQECSIYLDREARDTFFMVHFQYNYIGSKRSSDMSVISAKRFSSKQPLFVLEAKRLPTPGKKRQKEYVTGNLGGIERFKREVHGNGLFKSAILGYVQRGTFDYWHKEICSWINDLIKNKLDSSINWNQRDLLLFSTSLKKINKYSSIHTRITQPAIEIIHYWIYTS